MKINHKGIRRDIANDTQLTKAVDMLTLEDIKRITEIAANEIIYAFVNDVEERADRILRMTGRSEGSHVVAMREIMEERKV